MDAKFVKLYTAHNKDVLSAASGHRFGDIEKLIEEFWAKQKKVAKKTKPNLNKHVGLAAQCDTDLYKGIIDALMPDVFQKLAEGVVASTVAGVVTAVESGHLILNGETKVELSSADYPQLTVYATVRKDQEIKVGDKVGEVSLKKDIRNFGKKYDSWLTKAMEGQGFGPTFVKQRQAAGVAFTQKLRRYTSLCHLAQAARQVLSNQDHVEQMKKDYGQIDFVNVQEQVAWVCEGCDAGSMKKHEEAFPGKSKDENSLEKWAAWLQTIVKERLGTNDAYKDQASFEAKAAELLLRWSFISSLIMRELTLRSALSFGPFHLLRLLCDDYMYYIVEIAVAEKGFKQVMHVPGGDPFGTVLTEAGGGGAAAATVAVTIKTEPIIKTEPLTVTAAAAAKPAAPPVAATIATATAAATAAAIATATATATAAAAICSSSDRQNSAVPSEGSGNAAKDVRCRVGRRERRSADSVDVVPDVRPQTFILGPFLRLCAEHGAESEPD